MLHAGVVGGPDQTSIEPLVGVGHGPGVESHQVHDGVLQIVHGDGALGDGVAQLIGLPHHTATVHARPGHPQAEAVRVVITAPVRGAVTGLVHGRASELPAPDHKRLIQEAAPIQIQHQGCRRPVRLTALLGQGRQQIIAGSGAVRVPAPVVELNPTHAGLHEPSCQQAVVGKGGLPGLAAVELVNVRGLLTDIHELWDRGLHPKGQLVLADARFGLRIALLFGAPQVESREGVEGAAPQVAVHTLGVGDVEDRFTAAAQAHTLGGGGQKSAAPDTLAGGGIRSA